MERSRVLSFRDIRDKYQLGYFAPKMVACITSAFGQRMPERGVDSALKGDLVVSVVSRETNNVIGFSSLQRKTSGELKLVGYPENLRGFYFGASVIAEPFQGQGIYLVLNWTKIHLGLEEGIDFIAMHTQNPKVENGVSRALDMFVSSGNLKGYTLDRIYNPGFFGRQLTKDTLEVREGSCYSELNMDFGDCFNLIYLLQK